MQPDAPRIICSACPQPSRLSMHAPSSCSMLHRRAEGEQLRGGGREIAAYHANARERLSFPHPTPPCPFPSLLLSNHPRPIPQSNSNHMITEHPAVASLLAISHGQIRLASSSFRKPKKVLHHPKAPCVRVRVHVCRKAFTWSRPSNWSRRGPLPVMMT